MPMTKVKLITDPGQAFRCFADAYQTLEPVVPIDAATARLIKEIVIGISTGTPVLELLRKARLKPRANLAPNVPTCSEMFLKFLRQLRKEMVAQRAASISATRAAGLLYEADQTLHVDGMEEQAIMRLIDDVEEPFNLQPGDFVPATGAGILVSLRAYSERFGGVVWLRYRGLDCYDWSLGDPPAVKSGLHLAYESEGCFLTPNDVVAPDMVPQFLRLISST